MNDPPADSPSKRLRRAILERRSDWMVRQRDHGTWGNSQFNRTLHTGAPVYPSAARNDRVMMAGECERFLQLRDRVRAAGPVTLPGLVFPIVDPITGYVSAGYRPGDAITRLAPETVSPPDAFVALCELPLAANAARDDQGAIIAAVRWDFGLDPPTASTTLALEDPSKFIELKGAREGGRA